MCNSIDGQFVCDCEPGYYGSVLRNRAYTRGDVAAIAPTGCRDDRPVYTPYKRDSANVNIRHVFYRRRRMFTVRVGGAEEMSDRVLFHERLRPPISHYRVWSVIFTHNHTPLKRDQLIMPCMRNSCWSHSVDTFPPLSLIHI